MERIALLNSNKFLRSAGTLVCMGVVAACAPASVAYGVTFSAAAGLGLGWQTRADYGASTYARFTPEFVAFGYVGGIAGDLYLRPGVRFGYSSDHPEMPESVRVEETDVSFAGELGLVYDWYVIPSLTLGGGQISRSIRLRTSAPVSSSGEKISNSESLSFVYGQVGLGVPLWNGFIVAEPFARFQSVQGDRRAGTSLGVEVTAQML